MDSNQRSTFQPRISFNICLSYLGLRWEWLLNELQWRSANRVMFPYQHRVSTQKCCRCESAADLSHFSLRCHQGHCAAVLRTASNCGEWEVWKTSAPRAHQPSDTCVYESQLRCQHRERNMDHAAASHRPAEQCYLSSHRQHRPENILAVDCTVTLMIKVYFDCSLSNKKIKKSAFGPVCRGLTGLKSASWVMQHDLVWLNAHSPNWISTNASSSLSCLDKRWWKISTPALIKEMGHFDPTLN